MQLATINASVPEALLAGGPRARLIEELGTIRTYDAEETVYSQDEAADCWYLLMGGAARKCAQISDGRRQIMDFLLPGDLFGFEAGTRRECSVECVVPGTKVKRYRRPQMESLLEEDPKLARDSSHASSTSISDSGASKASEFSTGKMRGRSCFCATRRCCRARRSP